MDPILPDSILNRKKRGFAVPLDEWFRGKLDSYVRDLLLSDTCRSRGIFRPSAIESLIGLHKGGRNLDLHLWTLISFELWCRRFLDGARQAAPYERPDHRTIHREAVVA